MLQYLFFAVRVTSFIYSVGTILLLLQAYLLWLASLASTTIAAAVHLVLKSF
jgi:hypothetical protein